MSETECSQWVSCMAERIHKKISDIDFWGYHPYYNREYKFSGWVFKIVKGEKYTTLLLDFPKGMQLDVMERILDSHLKHVVKILE